MAHLNSRQSSRLIYASLLTFSLISLRCTTKPSTEAPKEAVAPAQQASADTSSLPPELRNVDSFDPAATIDPEVVKNSDFHQVKQTTEANRQAVDSEWKAQDALEESIRKAKEEEKKKQQEQEEKEKRELEEQRKEANRRYKSNAVREARYMKEAEERAKKLPTISKEEMLWNGLED